MRNFTEKIISTLKTRILTCIDWELSVLVQRMHSAGTYLPGHFDPQLRIESGSIFWFKI